MIVLKVGIVLSYIAMISMNVLANSLPLGGRGTGEISDTYRTIFTPAGFTFSIWGIIYLLLGIYVVHVTLMSQATFETTNQTVVTVLFIATCLINIGWLFSWHYDKIGLSTIVMILFLVTLILIQLNVKEDQLSMVAFSVYFGWISVALIANIAILLVKYDVSLFMNHEVLWFVIIVLVATLIGFYMIYIKENIMYGLVILWAFYGIYSKLKIEKVSLQLPDWIIPYQAAMSLLILGILLTRIIQTGFLAQK